MPVTRLLATAALTTATLPAAVDAQETVVVYGSVRDTSDGPLRAVVTVVGGGARSTADDQGRYRLSVAPGRRILRAVHIGYAPVSDTLTLGAGDSVERNYRLIPIAVELQPHVVSAAKRSQFLDQAVTSVAVLEQTEIARRAVTTVDEALDRAPGVQFLNGQVNIRGSSGYVQGLGSRVLLLVDGVPANQGDRGGINWDLLPLEQVERVEVVKGAGSSLYGSAALGGVVNLITREIPLGFHARVRLTGSVFGDPPHDIWRFRDYTGAREAIDVTGSYGTDVLRGSYSAGGWHSDGYRQQDRRDHWQTGGKAEWRPAAGTVVTGSGSWASDQYEVPLRWCVRGTCDDRGQAYQPFMVDTSDLGASTRSDKGYLAATLDRAVSERLQLHARGSWIRTHFTDVQPRVRNDWGVANRFGAELRAEARPAVDRVVTAGAEAAYSDVQTNIFTGETRATDTVVRYHSQTELAAYAESERVLGVGAAGAAGAARLTAGARIDVLSVDGGHLSAVVSPRVGAVLATARGAWRASISRGFRAPALAERFVSTEVSGLRVIPNPDLSPETAWSSELGNATRWSERLRSDAALFWTEAYDLIEPNVNLDSAEIQFRNVARARLLGLDLTVLGSPLTPRLTTSLAYTFLYARELAHDTNAERPLAFRPKHLLTLGADYRWGPFGVGGDFRYTSRFERVEVYLDDPRVDAKVLDLRASGEWDRLAARVLLTNALGYVYNLVPRTLAPVRTLSVTLTWAY